MISWIESVKQTGKLKIYAASLTGTWAHVFREALRDFNLLSKAHKLGVTITESHQPDEANVEVQTANGTTSASYDGETRSKDFDGGRLHGLTLLFSREPDKVLEKAFIYLPTEPKVNTPKGLRPAGAGVMKVIAAHELLHACGLENADHSSDDLFQGIPRVDAGATAVKDKVLIGTSQKAMPPLLLGGKTAKHIRDLWAA